MARGLAKVLYTSDDGRSFSTHIKKETLAVATAGWSIGPPANGSLPRRFRLRQVHGVDADGLRRSMSCGTPDCDLYALVAGTFAMRADDGTVVTYTVTGRTGERETVGG